jgi:glycosyltransferase involved in cell wall biosynthesis
VRVRLPGPSDARPGVTVVIPCHRHGRYLDAAVGAVLAQDDVDAQVIIVDDASPDDSLAVARRLAADERVQSSRTPPIPAASRPATTGSPP